MTTEYTVKTGIDSWVDEGNPNANHEGNAGHAVSDQRFAHIWIRVPAVQGSTIQQAKLRVRVRFDFPGSCNLMVRRIVEWWRVRTITWNNRPTITGISDTVAVSDVHRGDWIEFDLTSSIANVTNGVAYYGYRIESDSATTLYLEAFESGRGPQLYVVAGQAPVTPTALTPADGTIGVAKWTCSADFVDHVGDTDLAAMQVQVDAAADGASPDCDSGAVATTSPHLDLAETAYAGLASGASTQWRCRLKDGSGFWSDWSDWVSVTYTPKGTVTVTNPAGVTVGTPTPTITATYSGTPTDFRVTLTDAEDPTEVVYDSWRRPVNGDGSIAVEVPQRWKGRRVLRDDRDYRVRVRVWDDEDRVASVGDPTYAQAFATFAMDDDSEQTPPAGLAATQVDNTPMVQLSWTRGTQPDEFLIVRDGKVVDKVDAAEVSTGATTYEYLDVGVSGYRSHTWRVHAITSGARSPAATLTTSIEYTGVWLLSLDGSLRVQLAERSAVDQLANVDQAGEYDVLGRRYTTRVVTALGGRVGRGLEFAILDDRAGEGSRTWEDHEADLLAMKADPTASYRFAAGPDNLLVSLGNITCTPRSDMLPANVVRLVRLDVRQVGEFEYDGRV